MKAINPLEFCKLLWPDVRLYDKQREIVRSVWQNDETVVPAGNMLGKDYVAGLIALIFFLTHHPVRIVTTSVKDDHLDVLWGEIDRFIGTARSPLTWGKGGPLQYNHREIRKVVRGRLDKYSYLKGQVSKQGEGLSGHHAEHTLLIVDEASGVAEQVYDYGITWAQRILVIGNPNPCLNFFYKGVKAGNQKAKDNSRYYRKVIKIKAEDSPNVRHAKAIAKDPKRNGESPIVLPGVLTLAQYEQRRETWHSVRQCIGLDAEFPEGAEVLLYPPEWLNRAEQLAAKLEGQRRIGKRTMGVDTAQGGDNTSWAVSDNLGLIYQRSKKTPDTSVIVGETIALMREYNVAAKDVLFDMGGGGRQHADVMRRQGHKVQVIAFGASAAPEKRRGATALERRKQEDEVRVAYKNRRAEMYGILRDRLDISVGAGFAIPSEYNELRRQLSVIPLLYDDEGKLELPPKAKRDPNSTKLTMTDLVGHSPDEADALVLSVFGLDQRAYRPRAGAIL